MKHTIDGDHMCITTDYFVNLMESPALFIPVSDGIARHIMAYGLAALGSDEIKRMKEELIHQVPDEQRQCANPANGENCERCERCEWCELTTTTCQEPNPGAVDLLQKLARGGF